MSQLPEMHNRRVNNARGNGKRPPAIRIQSLAEQRRVTTVPR